MIKKMELLSENHMSFHNHLTYDKEDVIRKSHVISQSLDIDKEDGAVIRKSHVISQS